MKKICSCDANLHVCEFGVIFFFFLIKIEANILNFLNLACDEVVFTFSICPHSVFVAFTWNAQL